MKKWILAVLAMQIVLCAFVSAQPPFLEIPLEAGSQTDQLKAIIDGDAGAHSYLLKRGGIYWVTGIIENNFPLYLIGEEGPADQRPAMLIYKTDASGSAPDQMILAHDLVVLKNLYIVGIDDKLNFHRFYRTVDDEMKVYADNCVLNYSSSWQGHFEFRSLNGSVFFTNNLIMNMMQQDGYTWTNFFHTQGTKVDTIIFRHNTIFNCVNNVFAINNVATSPPNYALMENNTIVNNGKDIFHYGWWTNVISRNNIFHNVMIHGDAILCDAGYADRQQDTDYQAYAFFKIDTLEVEVGKALYDELCAAAGVPYQTASVHHNNYYQAPEIIDYLTNTIPADSGLVPQLLNERSRAMFDDDANWPGLYWDDDTNWQLDPGFTKDPTDVNALIVWGLQKYRGGDGVNFFWTPENDGNLFDFKWPITDYLDFTYSNETLRDEKGNHIGDLFHWYPDEYATSVGMTDAVPVRFELSGNYPNPFNPATRIHYTLQKSGEVTLTVHNLLGENVATLVREAQAPGSYRVSWDATNDAGMAVSAGVYFAKLQLGNQTQVQKMMLLK